jgi:hypothetical protein
MIRELRKEENMGFRLANVHGRAALVVDNNYYDVEHVSGGAIGADPMAVLIDPSALSALSATLGDHAATGSLADVTLGAPVPRPQKSFGIGLNYQAHADEGGMDVPNNPLVFTKFPSCIVGPTADVELRSDGCDYEGELLVVIGPGGKDINAPGRDGGRTTSLAASIDLPHTVLELCGLDDYQGMQGVSLVALLDDPGATVRGSVLVEDDFPAAELRRSLPLKTRTVVTDRHRYSRDSDNQEVLYDLTDDPDEYTNLAVRDRDPGAHIELLGVLADAMLGADDLTRTEPVAP